MLISVYDNLDPKTLVVNDIDILENNNVLKTIQDIFAEMGVPNAYAASKRQYVGHDSYMSFIFGDLNH